MKKLADISQFESVCGSNQGVVSDLSVFNLDGNIADYDDLEYGNRVYDTKRGVVVCEVFRASDPEDIGYVVEFDGYGGPYDETIFWTKEEALDLAIAVAQHQKEGRGYYRFGDSLREPDERDIAEAKALPQIREKGIYQGF